MLKIQSIFKTLKLFLIVVFLFSCETSECSFNCDIDFQSEEFEECIDLTYDCSFSGDYCLFGLKWGLNNEFHTSGENIEGPKTPGGIVTFSFQENAKLVSNHKQVDVPTLSFDLLPNCAKKKIEDAFEEWSTFGNIQFQKVSNDSNSDIKIYVADIYRAGLAFPNFNSANCQILTGQITFNPNDIHFPFDCDQFYLLALHEVGHCLGLGHSSEANVMGNIFDNFQGLQQGDIEGIVQIYDEN